jgi:hypothetical protein
VGAQRVPSVHGSVHTVPACRDGVLGIRRDESFDVMRVERFDLALYDIFRLHSAQATGRPRGVVPDYRLSDRGQATATHPSSTAKPAVSTNAML